MAKPTPIECNPDNCADVSRCGTNANYAARGCRCEPCREASRAYRKAYHDKNREKANAGSRAWKSANAEHVSAYNRKYRAADPVATKTRDAQRCANRCKCDECVAAGRDYQRRYYAENRDKKLAYYAVWAELNTATVRKHRSAYFHKRRALLRDAWIENIDPAVVFECNAYICQRCGIKCPRDAVWPAKDFPTIDHIKPLTKGGLHAYANVQTLCLSCNSAKGNRE